MSGICKSGLKFWGVQCDCRNHCKQTNVPNVFKQAVLVIIFIFL